MTLRLHAPDRFFEVTRPLWEPREAELNLFVGIAARLAASARPDDALLATLERGSQCVAAALRTPPHGLVVAAEDELAASSLARALADHPDHRDAPSVFASTSFAARFAEVWASRVGGRAELQMAQRIYALEQVVWPALPAGQFRPVRTDELDRVAVWVRELMAEAAPHAAPSHAEVVAMLEGRARHDAVYVWSVDELAVSVAVVMRETPHGAAVSAVCTPPEHRRRGYASACVAALSQRALDRGKRFTCLHTDASNPTSNAIYQRIGYRFVAAAEQWALAST
jgi:predicted GNAT family acetyltransferase